jgi:hypothetical protein
MIRIPTLTIAMLLVILSAAGLSLAVTLQLTTTADISGASQDASQNYYVTEGNSFDVDLNVLNPAGSSDSATNIEATISLPAGLSTGDALTKTVAASLAPGGDADVSWTVTGDVAGNYLGQIGITTQGTNTAQNSDTTGVLVKSPATIVGGISCSATDSKVVKTDFDVTVTVQNLGDLDATGISINLSSSPGDISISNPRAIASIDGGSSGSSTYSSLSTSQATTYTFTTTVTSDNAGSDTTGCSAETVASLPNGYVCTSHSACSTNCCSGALCVASAVCQSGGDGGNGGGGGGSGYTTPGAGDKNASSRPSLVPGVGLRNNTKLQAALEKVLAKGKMSEQARQNLLRLSESITSDIEVQRNFKYSNGTSSMENRYKYTGQNRVRNLAVYDKIPKDFAEHSDNITVTSPGATVEVVDADPEYLLLYGEVTEGEEMVITYSVESNVDETVIDSFGTEIYAEEVEEGAAPPTVCTDGAVQCSGNDVQVCQSNAWVFQETCEYGCSGGVCQGAPLQPSDYMFLTIIVVIIIIIIAGAAFFVLRSRKHSSGGKAPSTSSTKMSKF